MLGQNCYTLVTQLKDSIQVVSVSGKTREIFACKETEDNFMTQDQLGNIFIAELSQGKTKIYMLKLEDNLVKKQ